jgi:hypothetical protein
MKKIILSILTFLILFSNTLLAQIELQDTPSDGILQEQTASAGKFSFSAGFGRAYGLAGGMLLYDFPNNLGIGISIGGLSLGGNVSLSLRYNFQKDNSPLVLSPALSVFAHTGQISMYHHQHGWQPGAAFSVDSRSYLGKYTYVNNSIGLECALGKSSNDNYVAEEHFHTGIGGGFTFGKETVCIGWESEARIFTSDMNVIGKLVQIVASS